MSSSNLPFPIENQPSIICRSGERKYVARLDEDGEFVSCTPQVSGNFRLLPTDTLVVDLPAGSKFAQQDTVLEILDSTGNVDIIRFKRNPLGGGFAEWTPTVCGPAELTIKSVAFGTPDADLVLPNVIGARNLIIVEAATKLNGLNIPVDGLSLLTVVSSCLGPLNRWVETLSSACALAEYTAIHFCPIQQAGSSGSCYSLSDQLSVSSQFTKSSREKAWQEVKAIVDEIEHKYGAICLVDVVLNHTADSSPWLQEHPECGYNAENSPWLIAAIELDEAIGNFALQLVDKKFEGKYRVGTTLNDEHDLGRLMDAFRNECLNPFVVGEWFTLDIEANVEAFRDMGQIGDVVVNPVDFGYEEALKWVGCARNGLILPDEVICMLATSEAGLRNVLMRVQKQLYDEAEKTYRAIWQSVEGNVRYERLTVRKGPFTKQRWNGLAPRYFVEVKANNGDTFHMACNGWVASWDCKRDFAGPGALVYLKRSLYAWSDCVRLRYGDCREDCPFLWDYMSDYCRISAQTFHGFRLDNCHTTPLHVGKHVLSVAREARNNLFVFAELFTGNPERDLEFETELGLDALVREAIHSHNNHDLGKYAESLGGNPVGHLPRAKIDERYGCKSLIPRRAKAIFYDLTHDNPTLFQNNRINDTLAVAAFVSAANTISASTFGFDTLVPQNPSVVGSDARYRIIDFEAEGPENPQAEKSKTVEIVVDFKKAQSVILRGSFNDWKSGVEMTKERDGLWHCSLNPSDNLSGQEDFRFKFVVDGKWVISDRYPNVADEQGHRNNVIKLNQSPRKYYPGILSARKILNRLHLQMAVEGCSEIEFTSLSNDMGMIMRHSPAESTAYYFIIRSAFWQGNDVPGAKFVSILGRVEKVHLCAYLKVPQWAYDNYRSSSSQVTGYGDFGDCLRDCQEPSRSYDATKDVTTLTFDTFPSGSVFVCKVKMDNAYSNIATELSKMINSPLDGLSLTQMSYLLYSCEREERDRSAGARGCYQFPNYEELVFSGFAGAVPILNNARLSCSVNHPFNNNTRDGNWFLEYQVNRLRNLDPKTESSELFADGFTHVVQMVQNVKQAWRRPRLVDLILSKLYPAMVFSILQRMQPFVLSSGDEFTQDLALATLQFYSYVPSAPLIAGTKTASLSAGLPHFSAEYMRVWGRDTFISLPGILLSTGRFKEAEETILGFAKVLRHALMPNLLDGGSNPRYNARDATWFFLQAIKEYVIEAPEGPEILKKPIELKYADQGLGYEPAPINNLADMIHCILSCHARGISYREWNSGERIDAHMKSDGFDVNIKLDRRTGMLLGGNRSNCGTWMDKMGSSDKAGNRGVPASPRDGAPVELVALLRSILHFVTKDLPTDVFPYSCASYGDGSTGIEYSEWLTKIDDNFEKEFYITKAQADRIGHHLTCAGTYKDTWGSLNQCEDYYVRPNMCIALALMPKVVNSEHARQALQVVKTRLYGETGQLGMKTLDLQNSNYRPDYDNGNDGYDRTVAHGFNYHMGPEWVWPLGHFLEAYLRLREPGQRLAHSIHDSVSLLLSQRRFVRSNKWMSLPEVTNRGGRLCHFSCDSQAWSVGTILRFLHKVVLHSTSNGANWKSPLVTGSGKNRTFTRSFSQALIRSQSRVGARLGFSAAVDGTDKTPLSGIRLSAVLDKGSLLLSKGTEEDELNEILKENVIFDKRMDSTDQPLQKRNVNVN